MKLLDTCKLQEFSRTILQRSTEMGCPLDTKFELYSCKMAGFQQKKTWKEMRQQGDPLQLQKMSPYEHLEQLDMLTPAAFTMPTTASSCNDSINRAYRSGNAPPGSHAKSLSPPRPYDPAPSHGNTDNDVNLISVSADNIVDDMAITRKDLWRLQTILDMAYEYEHDFQGLEPKYFCKEPSSQFLFHLYDGIAFDLWRELDEAIKLNECVAYSFHPDASCNPEHESLRTEWIFLHNRKLKRMMYVCMREISISDIGTLPFYENDLSHVAINNGASMLTSIANVAGSSDVENMDCM